jgi:hypothetical protein
MMLAQFVLESTFTDQYNPKRQTADPLCCSPKLGLVLARLGASDNAGSLTDCSDEAPWAQFRPGSSLSIQEQRKTAHTPLNRLQSITVITTRRNTTLPSLERGPPATNPLPVDIQCAYLGGGPSCPVTLMASGFRLSNIPDMT